MIDCIVLEDGSVICDSHSKWLSDIVGMVPVDQKCFCIIANNSVVQGRVVRVNDSVVIAARQIEMQESCIACCVVGGKKRVVLPANSIEHAVEQASTACQVGGIAKVEFYPIS